MDKIHSSDLVFCFVRPRFSLSLEMTGLNIMTMIF